MGYGGSYSAVRRYGVSWAKKRGQAATAAYIPLSFAPGEVYQFDGSHEIVIINGATVTVKLAHVRLCRSRMIRRVQRAEVSNALCKPSVPVPIGEH